MDKIFFWYSSERQATLCHYNGVTIGIDDRETGPDILEKVSELIHTSECSEHPATDDIPHTEEIWDELLAVGSPVDGVEPPHYSSTLSIEKPQKETTCKS